MIDLEAAPPDIRDIAATEPTRGTDDTVRVPTAPESADNLAHARRALAEVHQRRADEQRYAADAARAQQIARWHQDDLVAHQHTTAHAVPELAMDGAP